MTTEELAKTKKCPYCGAVNEFAAQVEAWQGFEFNEKGEMEYVDIDFGDWTGIIYCRGCGEEIIK